MSDEPATTAPPPPRRWSKVVLPAIVTLLIVATLLPSVGSFHVFLIIITIAIIPIALLISGIRSGSAKVERIGWILFGLNCLFFLLIIS